MNTELEQAIEDAAPDPEDHPDTEESNGSSHAYDLMEFAAKFYDMIVNDIVSKTKVVEVKRVGFHVIRRYANGKSDALSPRRWVGDRDEALGPTPYELISAGEYCPELYPERLNPWLLGAPGIIAGMATLFGIPMLRDAARRRR